MQRLPQGADVAALAVQVALQIGQLALVPPLQIGQLALVCSSASRDTTLNHQNPNIASIGNLVLRAVHVAQANSESHSRHLQTKIIHVGALNIRIRFFEHIIVQLYQGTRWKSIGDHSGFYSDIILTIAFWSPSGPLDLVVWLSLATCI